MPTPNQPVADLNTLRESHATARKLILGWRHAFDEEEWHGIAAYIGGADMLVKHLDTALRASLSREAVLRDALTIVANETLSIRKEGVKLDLINRTARAALAAGAETGVKWVVVQDESPPQ